MKVEIVDIKKVIHDPEDIGKFVLHYHVTRRQDTPFWRSRRAMDTPGTLRHRIELFRETGRVFRAPGELFAENSWIQVMLGQGIEGDGEWGREHRSPTTRAPDFRRAILQGA